MVEEIIEDEDSSSESDDGTMMTVEEVTGTSVGSAGSAVSGRSDVSGNESSTLDEALRIAAQRAGTQRLDEEQSDDAEEEVIPSFGWIKKGTQTHQQSNAQLSEEENHSDNETEMDMDMDVTNAVGGIIRQDVQQSDREEDMSMEVTRALGGILPQSKPSEGNLFAVYGHDEPSDEATMELTTAIGGIRQSQPEDASELLDDEDMSMEFTTVMGGVLARQKRASVGTARRKSVSQQTEADDVTMDMTVGLGRIVLGSDINNDDNDATVGMDMTQALGGVISNAEDKNRTLRKRIMEEEADRPNSPKAAVIAALSQPSPQKRVSPRRKPQVSVESSDTDNRAFQGKGLRRSIGPQSVPMEKNRAEAYTPSPSRTRTRPGSGSSKRSTPGSHRQPSQSPSRSNTLPITTPARNTPTQLKSSSSSLFQTDTETGSRTPLIVLTPQPRRLSGLGADRSGLGSPRVTALLERRTSIGEAATSFTPGKRAVAFQDPKELSHEVDRERQLENDREDGRTILEREADGADDNREAPVNLRDMIDSLSPKRIPLKGRKSLHVGSAQGLLGKRPAELDDDDDSEENDGVKRLKGHQGSPVKNVRLQNPPSKSETTGRFNKSTRRSLEPPGQITTPTLSSPTKGAQNTTPRNQTRFRNVDDDHSTQGINFNATPKDPDQLAAEAEEGRIHLQDFLNMTSIRFMELTTTKRRHTIAPTNFADGTGSDGQDDMCLERCVVAGACTVPTLELYQHSCRELKKYISEGRRIVKEIEADTFEDNPPLFREYLSASPDVKTLMDNQFKNVKTHARLLSKAMWYEWRMKLQDGLKEGLIKISEGMTRDEEHLQQQQQLLESVVPTMVSRYDALQEESESLQDIAREIADCDPAELQGARDELNDLSESIAQKKRLIAQLRRQFEESEQEVHELATRKQDCITEIQGFEKVRDECRGWTGAEVEALKGENSSPGMIFVCLLNRGK
jgi:kinetochore protein Spc7/SPC105